MIDIDPKTHFMYLPLFGGSGYPSATAPSEAQNRPAETPHVTAPTKTNQTVPYPPSQYVFTLRSEMAGIIRKHCWYTILHCVPEELVKSSSKLPPTNSTYA
jgi:hypothetical protein